MMAICLDLFNIRFATLFLCIYAVFNAVLSLTSFFARVHTLDLSLTFKDALKAIALCLFEVTILRFILALTRFFSLFSYHRNKRKWGKIERKKLDIQ